MTERREEVVLQAVRLFDALERARSRGRHLDSAAVERVDLREGDDARAELMRVERLSEKIVGAGRQALDEAVFRIGRGEDQDGKLRFVELRAEDAAHLDAGRSRHLPVEHEHARGAAVGDHLEQVSGVEELRHRVHVRQRARGDLALERTVVEHPDAGP